MHVCRISMFVLFIISRCNRAEWCHNLRGTNILMLWRSRHHCVLSSDVVCRWTAPSFNDRSGELETGRPERLDSGRRCACKSLPPSRIATQCRWSWEVKVSLKRPINWFRWRAALYPYTSTVLCWTAVWIFPECAVTLQMNVLPMPLDRRVPFNDTRLYETSFLVPAARDWRIDACGMLLVLYPHEIILAVCHMSTSVGITTVRRDFKWKVA